MGGRKTSDHTKLISQFNNLRNARDVDKIYIINMWRTLALRMAVLAGLPFQKHSNPARAALGEYEFFYSKRHMAKHTDRKEIKFEATAQGKFKDAQEY